MPGDVLRKHRRRVHEDRDHLGAAVARRHAPEPRLPSRQASGPIARRVIASSFSTDDTIVAIATPPGRGGLGVVRVSGPTPRRAIAAALTARGRRRRSQPRARTHARARHATWRTSRTRRRRPGRRSPTSRRHTRTPARMSSRSARMAVRCCCARSCARRWTPAAAWRSRRVHAAGVSSWPDRSRAGRGGARSRSTRSRRCRRGRRSINSRAR